jgi:hypothetical protein
MSCGVEGKSVSESQPLAKGGRDWHDHKERRTEAEAGSRICYSFLLYKAMNVFSTRVAFLGRDLARRPESHRNLIKTRTLAYKLMPPYLMHPIYFLLAVFNELRLNLLVCPKLGCKVS